MVRIITLSPRALMARVALCTLLASPLAVRAQVAEKPADASYTLRMKYKEGEVNKYRSVMEMGVISPTGADGSEAPMQKTKVTLITEQKISKLLEKGIAEIILSTKNIKVDSTAKDAPEPKLNKTSIMTMKMDELGKIISVKSDTADDAADEGIKALFGNGGMTTTHSFLPEQAVKVGDKWTQKVDMSNALFGSTGTIDCTFVRMEKTGDFQTAHIHTVLKMPVSVFIDMMGKPTKLEADGMVCIAGTINVVSEINFAIEDGKIVHTTQETTGQLGVKAAKGAPPEVAASLPPDMKITLKSNLEMNLLPPGTVTDEANPVEPKKKDK